MCFLRASSRGPRPTAPTIFWTTVPFLNIKKWGMLIIPYRPEIWLFWSTFTFPNFAFPSYALASSSITGAIILQGMHQSAQKSIRTGMSEFMKLSKDEEVNATTPLPSILAFTSTKVSLPLEFQLMGIIKTLWFNQRVGLYYTSDIILEVLGEKNIIKYVQKHSVQ